MREFIDPTLVSSCGRLIRIARAVATEVPPSLKLRKYRFFATKCLLRFVCHNKKIAPLCDVENALYLAFKGTLRFGLT